MTFRIDLRFFINSCILMLIRLDFSYLHTYFSKTRMFSHTKHISVIINNIGNKQNLKFNVNNINKHFLSHFGLKKSTEHTACITVVVFP